MGGLKRVPWIAGALALASTLSGCDFLVLSTTMPGLAPGVGSAVTGTVVDSRTGLPLGHATVMAGWVSAQTDNSGHFSVYFDLSGNRSLSIARAGYVSLTLETGKISNEDTYSLTPTFTDSGRASARKLNVVGTLKNPDSSAMTANGNVSIARIASSATNQGTGRYAVGANIDLGAVFSTILAGGQISGGPVDGTTPQPYNYVSFGYRNVDLPLIPTDSDWKATADLSITQGQAFSDMTVIYKGVEAFDNPSPRTDVSLDFGLLGSVPVGRGFSTNQTLHVPKIDGAKYVIEGGVTDDSKGTASKVTVLTNLPTQAEIQLLAPPKVQSPANGSAGVGANPTFSWSPVPGAGSYLVEVNEDLGGSNIQAKWKGSTTSTSMRYPGFWGSDPNGGALYPGATYSWTVHAYASDVGFTTQALDMPDALPSAPYRRRSRESSTGGMRFSP